MGTTVRLVTVLIGLTVVGLLVCASSYADLMDGLVAVWTFDDGTAKDFSGNGNNGEILDNPMVVQGKFGRALEFDGDNDGVEIEDDVTLQLTEPFTVAVWIFPHSCKDHSGIVWKGRAIGWGTDVYNYRIAQLSTNGITWGACTGPVEGYFGTAGVLSKMDVWYHLALVEDGVKGIAYVNGKSGISTTEGDSNRPAPPYFPSEGEPVRIGWSVGSQGTIPGDVYFEGIIDEVFLYNRPLDEGEINALMNGGVSFPVESAGKLVATWARIKAD